MKKLLTTSLLLFAGLITVLIAFSTSVQASNMELIEEDIGECSFIDSDQESYPGVSIGMAGYEFGEEGYTITIMELSSEEEAKSKLSFEDYDIIEIAGNKVEKSKSINSIGWYSETCFVYLSVDEDEHVPLDIVKAYLELYPSSIEGDIENAGETARFKDVQLIKGDIGSIEFLSSDIEKKGNYNLYNLEYKQPRKDYSNEYHIKIYEFKNMYQARAYYSRIFARSQDKIFDAYNKNIVNGKEQSWGYLKELNRILWVSGRFIVFIEKGGEDIEVDKGKVDEEIITQYLILYPSELTLEDNDNIITDESRFGYKGSISFSIPTDEFYAAYSPRLSSIYLVFMIKKDSDAIRDNVLDLDKVGDFLGYDNLKDSAVLEKSEGRTDYFYRFDAQDGTTYEIWTRGSSLNILQRAGNSKWGESWMTQEYLNRIPSHLIPTMQNHIEEPEEAEDNTPIQLPDCDGCKRANGYCVKTGHHVTIKDREAYCSPSGKFVALKALNKSCQRSYECESGECRYNKCYSIVQQAEGRGFFGTVWVIFREAFKHTWDRNFG